MVNIFSEAYKAKESRSFFYFFLQTMDLLIIIPTCLISLQFGFWEMVYARAFMRLDLIIPELIVMNTIIGISAITIMKNVIKPIICTIIMAISALMLKTVPYDPLWNALSIALCAVVYFTFLLYIDKRIYIYAKKIIVSK